MNPAQNWLRPETTRSRAMAAGLALLLAAAGLLGLQHLAAGSARAGRSEAEPDLRVALIGPSSAAPGAVSSYRLAVTNTGGAASTGTVLSLTLPAALSPLSASEAYSQALPGTLRWSLGELAAGVARWITLEARLPVTAALGAAPPLVLEARGALEEPELDDNRAERALEVAPTDLRVSIGSLSEQLRPGDRVTHTITLVNVSRQAADGLVVTAELSGASWISDTAEAPENGFRRQTVAEGLRWERDRVPGPWTAHIDLVSQVPLDAGPGARVQHTISLSAATRDATAVDDRASSAPLGVAQGDLYVELSGPTRAAPDDGMELSLVYGNRGPGRAGGVVLTETLPAGVAYVSASPPAERRGSSELVWRLGELPAGAEDIIRVQTRLTGSLAAGLTLTHRARIAGAAPDLAPADDRARLVTEIVPGRPARLALSGGASVLPVDEGRTELEAVVLDAYDNRVTEPVTVSFGAGGGRVVPASRLSAGGVATATFEAGARPGDFEIEARSGALRDRIALRLEPADLALSGQLRGPEGLVSSSQVLPGDGLSYTLGLRNDGLATARGLVLATATDPRLLAGELETARPVTETAVPEGLIETPTSDYELRAWRLPDLGSGQRLTLTLHSRVDPAPAEPWTGFDPLFVRAALTTTTAERSPLDLLHTEKVDVRAADLYAGLELNGLASSIRPGGHLAYDLTYGNLEAAEVAGAVLTFTLPISTSYDHWMPLTGPALEPVAGRFDQDSPSLAWAVDGLVPRSGGLRLWLDIDPEAPAEELLQGEVSVGSPVFDVHLGNNRAVDSGAWLSGVNLQSRLTGPQTVEPGGVLSWRIEVENAAIRDSAEDVIVLVEPSPGLTHLRSDPPASPGPGGRLSWLLERPLAAGAARAFELDLSVPEDAEPGAELRLQVDVSSRNRESHAGDNRAQAVVRVVPGAPSRLDLSAERERLTACNDDATRLRLEVADAFGNAVADGAVVRWSTSLGRLDVVTSTTAAGRAEAMLTAGRTVGRARVTATVAAAQAELTIDLQPGPPGALSVTADPAAVANDDRTQITVQVVDACANPVADGWPIVLRAERGRWSDGGAEVLLPTVSGRVRSTLSVGREPGPLRVVAEHEGLRGETLVSVEPPPPYLYLPFASRR